MLRFSGLWVVGLNVCSVRIWSSLSCPDLKQPAWSFSSSCCSVCLTVWISSQTARDILASCWRGLRPRHKWKKNTERFNTHFHLPTQQTGFYYCCCKQTNVGTVPDSTVSINTYFHFLTDVFKCSFIQLQHFTTNVPVKLKDLEQTSHLPGQVFHNSFFHFPFFIVFFSSSSWLFTVGRDIFHRLQANI